MGGGFKTLLSSVPSLPSYAPTHAYLFGAEILCHRLCGRFFGTDGKNLELVMNNLPLQTTGHFPRGTDGEQRSKCLEDGRSMHLCGSSS